MKSLVINNLANIAYQDKRNYNKDDYYVSQGSYVSKGNNISTYTSNYNIGNTNQFLDNSYNLCGIINTGNNCYLNSGLLILARCSSLVDKLQIFYSKQYPFIAELYEAFKSLLTVRVYDPSSFVKYFCEINQDFNIFLYLFLLL
jgi:uncharacterized UBP type Zn finger protein